MLPDGAVVAESLHSESVACTVSARGFPPAAPPLLPAGALSVHPASSGRVRRVPVEGRRSVRMGRLDTRARRLNGVVIISFRTLRPAGQLDVREQLGCAGASGTGRSSSLG